MRTRPALKPARARRGLSFVELMISLAITSMLLTAVAASFQASSQVVQNNDQFFRASQSARVSLNQILVALRQSKSVTGLAEDYVKFNDRDDAPMSFVYDPDAKTLECVPGTSVTGPGYVMARNVTGMKFEKVGAGSEFATRIVVTITVRVGDDRANNEVTMSGSVAPRRAQDFDARKTI